MRKLTILGLSAAALALAACQQQPAAETATDTAEAPAETTETAAAERDPGTPLAVGDTAPMFETEGALAGKPFKLDLASELKQGPVVLYFFPKAFTEGCTLESKEFADRNADFEAAGAKVFGLSADDTGTLAKFSTEACRDKFAVATATPEVIKGYGVALSPDKPLTSRTSYVIAPDGTVAMVHSDMDYQDHVRLTYEAVQKLGGKSAS